MDVNDALIEITKIVDKLLEHDRHIIDAVSDLNNRVCIHEIEMEKMKKRLDEDDLK